MCTKRRILFVCFTALNACNGYSTNQLLNGEFLDRKYPAVVFITPANRSSDQAVTSPITIVFNQDMDVASTAAAFSLKQIGANSTEVSGAVTFSSGNSLKFTPTKDLLYKTSYQVKVSTTAMSTTREKLLTEFGAIFTTGTDTVLPTLLSGTPTDGSSTVSPCSGNPCRAKVVLVFSESMNAGLSQTMTTGIIDGSSFASTPNTGTTFSFSTTNNTNDTLTINFSWYWFPENSMIRYTIDLNGLQDLAGNSIAANIQRTFSTTTANQILTVADTGQTSCYDNTNPQACPVGSFPRQDADYSGIPIARSFTGPTQHATYTNDYTTKDNVTTLVWKACTEGLSGATCAAGAASTMTWYGAINQCAVLNSVNGGAGYAGRANWRLPTIEEWETLPNFNAFNPSMETANFPASISGNYWSSSPHIGALTNAWDYGFNGNIATNLKSSNYYVRCVSGGSFAFAAGPYVDNADGTVSDTTTNLRWQKCSQGQTNDASCSGTASTADWQTALQYCNGLNLAAKSWRLPSINELRALVDKSALSPSIKGSYFPATMASNYWSSSTFIAATTNAWFVGFDYGYSTGNSKTTANYVRCVTQGP